MPNCGIASGGFQRGNTCARGGGGKQAAKRFEKITKRLHEDGHQIGAHKRLAVPKHVLSEKDLGRLGFFKAFISIPEAGQARFSSFRHADNKFHLHDHTSHWTIHEDSHYSSASIVKKLDRLNKDKSSKGKLKHAFRVTKANLAGIPHLVQEGLPGAFYYAKGRLSRGEGTLDRVLKGQNKQFTRRLSGWKPSLNQRGTSAMARRFTKNERKRVVKALIKNSGGIWKEDDIERLMDPTQTSSFKLAGLHDQMIVTNEVIALNAKAQKKSASKSTTTNSKKKSSSLRDENERRIQALNKKNKQRSADPDEDEDEDEAPIVNKKVSKKPAAKVSADVLNSKAYEQKWLRNAPTRVRNLVGNMAKMEFEQKKKLVKRITANSDVFNRDELMGKDIKELSKLAKALSPRERESDFYQDFIGAAGGDSTRNSRKKSEGDEPLAVTAFDMGGDEEDSK